MIKAAVCGACGRMGRRIIKTISAQEDMKVVAAIEAPDSPQIGEDAGKTAGIGKIGVKVIGSDKLEEELKKSKADVLVDFTVAEAAVKNVEVGAKAGVAIVVGTTGFSEEQKNRMEKAIQNAEVPAIIAPNMSVGVNVFFKLAEQAAKLLKNYDVELVETHHDKKLDAPSGTAMKAAEIVAKSTDRELDKVAKFGRPKGELGERPKDEIGIHSVRAGDVTGEHELIFAGPSERLELIHRAQSKQAFVSGVIKAIQHIVKEGKPGEIQDMQDVLRLK
ncbi:dihydrodipicolinate reductase [candidate division MSBL1 archaeon SCGC-AAA261O19]|uniref:4-hydroxy-tetrahydrodipicolinate reductase n=3 Tax=candidate division MSBL1 TaxID=215777 RepID=A0A133V0W9_9EURY|nr:dihydrodipicolinate reductase [candidate division MSBL1 archaeon SCGC-AAA261C02]KXB04502.1 dihydrodipicolinate reductase [candidate division MSBL1 archaeon SCGC-AAA261O19]KXB09061.1 dihydrodipicolinate reductase [candidate division MSBL1 archaeon SCGC-AAA833K04]